MRRLAAIALALLATAVVAQAPRSGLDFQSEDIRRLQADDFANPAMLWAERGAAAWQQRRGTANKSCADCHGAAEQSMRGVAARLPAWDTRQMSVSTLDQRINACTVREQGAAESLPEADTALALQAYVALQSRGMPLRVAVDGPAQTMFDLGRELYRTRIGQMNLACMHCHEQQAGKTLLSASNGNFPLHTDESFELQPARWVLLHCWRPSATGGETRLADSHLVAKRAERSLGIALSQWHLPYPCGDMPTLAADLRVRFNRAECEFAASRRAWPPGPALAHWLDRFEQAFEQVADGCRLNSGDLLIIDNWRVLHGRCAFPADSGRQLKRLRVLQDSS